MDRAISVHGCCPPKRRKRSNGCGKEPTTPERPAPVVASYVRVAVGSGALQRLRDEEGYYRTINDGHRRHFEALHVQVGSVGVAASTRTEVLEWLAPYHSTLDLPIIRVLAAHDVASLRAVTIAAAP